MRRGVSTAMLAGLVCLALCLPAMAQQLPAPEEFAGFKIGSDGNLVHWDKIVEYFQKADAASDRIVVQELGKTTMDNPFLLTIISSPKNIARLDEIKATQRRIAYPYDLSDDEARELAWNTPAVLLITLNIHSTEIGSSQMGLELIHRLATEDSPWMRNVLDNVVFLLVPSMNPDGQILVTDWYNETKDTDHSGSSMPWLYHYYTGHDNNRDAFMLTQKESRMLTKVLYQDWFPQVFLDEHQMGFSNARIFVPPWTNPINPNVDPTIWAENGLLGFAMFNALHSAGKTGIIYDQTYTSWWQGGFVMEAWWHNIVGLLTEVASVRVATPIEQEMGKLGVPPKGPAMSRRELRELLEKDPDAELPAPRDVMPRNNYPRPWLGGKWTLRDIVDYELIATYALLEATANNRVTLIENQIKMGKNAIEEGKKGNPYAYVFPADQHDPGAVLHMLEILDYAGVEVHRATEAFEAGDENYPAGTHVILMAQPFRAYAKDMLEIQKHPDPKKFPPGTIRDQPYDVTGWTLPLQMGVESVEVKKSFEAKLARVDFSHEGNGNANVIVSQGGTVRGRGWSFLIPPESNNRVKALNRLLKLGAQVSWLPGGELNGREYAPGAIRVTKPDNAQVIELAKELGLEIEATKRAVRGVAKQLRKPRIGLYQPWTASMDEGWTRWLLEQYEFEYSTLHNQDIKDGKLSEKFDAIIFPGDRNKQQIMTGNRSKRTPKKYRGGIGKKGLKELRKFVRAGGTLILMDRSTELALESWPLPIKNAMKGLSRQKFSCPGSLLKIQVDVNHPVAYGMPEEATAFYQNSAAFDLAPGFSYTDVKVIARYPATNPLQSGWIRGPEHLYNKIAAAEVGYDKGRIILIGFRPQFRAQPHGTFKLFFNALHYSAAE